MSAESGAHAQALEQEIPWLRSLARRLATEDADDLVQETWIRARDKPPQHRSGLRPWLGSILRNNHRMARRSARARARRESGQAAPDVPSVETLVAAQQIHALLAELLEDLDEEDRHIIRERYVADRSAVEIAQELGIPAATVRTRLRRALTKLRSQLDERCGGRRAWAMVAAGSGLPQLGVVIVMKAVFGASLVAAVAAGALWMTRRGGFAPRDCSGRGRSLGGECFGTGKGQVPSWQHGQGQAMGVRPRLGAKSSPARSASWSRSAGPQARQAAGGAGRTGRGPRGLDGGAGPAGRGGLCRALG